MPEREVEKDYEVFEENELSISIFIKLMTQWRTTMSGVIGLDYSVLQMLFSMYDVNNKVEIFDDIQVMEREALKHLNKDNKK